MWSSCTVSCGGGLRKRSRVCNTKASYSKASTICPGKSVQQKQCHKQCSVMTLTWTNWGSWTSCAHDCKKSRIRKCVSKKHVDENQLGCLGSDSETRDCAGGMCIKETSHSEDKGTKDEYSYITTNNIGLSIVITVALIVIIMLLLIFIAILRRRFNPEGYTLADSPMKSGKTADHLVYDIHNNCEITDSIIYGCTSYSEYNVNNNKEMKFRDNKSEHFYETPIIRASGKSPIDSILNPLISESSGSSTGGNI